MQSQIATETQPGGLVSLDKKAQRWDALARLERSREVFQVESRASIKNSRRANGRKT